MEAKMKSKIKVHAALRRNADLALRRLVVFPRGAHDLVPKVTKKMLKSKKTILKVKKRSRNDPKR